MSLPPDSVPGKPAPARRRGPAFLLLGLGFSAVLTVVLGLVLEFAAGFLVEPLRAREITGDAVSRTVTYIEVNPAPLVRDADLLWRNQPGVRKTQLVNPKAFGRNDEWTIENNSEAFRGPERDRGPKAEGTIRVLCVGDSVTFGFSVDQPDAYPELLAGELRRRYPGRRIEVINAGVPGWSWMQGLHFLDLYVDELEPDAIVIGHGTNDQLFPAKMTDEERFLRLGTPLERAAQRVAVLAAETNIYRAASRLRPAREDDDTSKGCREQILRTGGCRRVSLPQIEAAVHEAGVLARSRGIDLLVANTDFVQTPAVRATRPAAERDGIPYVDLVGEVMRLRKVDEEERARRLGLGPADALTPGKVSPDAKQVVLRTTVPDPSRSYRVAGFVYFRPDVTFAADLRDDGTGGDEKAGDGVFSGTVTIPAPHNSIEYKYWQGDVAEFAAIPPLASTLGDRVLHLTGSGRGPVDEFGRSLFLVERAHPNRDGTRVMAGLVAEALAGMKSFQGIEARPGAAAGAAGGE